MAEIIGFLMVFGVLALIISTLATGVVRIVGFGVLIAIALFAGAPIFRGLSVSNLFPGQGGNQAPAQSQPYTTGQPSTNLPSTTTGQPTTTGQSQTDPSYADGTYPGGTYPSGTYPNSGSTYPSTGGATSGGTYSRGTGTSTTNRGIRGGW